MTEAEKQAEHLEQYSGEAIYGIEWGDPVVDLPCVLKEWIEPRISPESVVLEIGSGGGRWTRYLSGAKLLYSVDGTPKSEQLVREAFSKNREHFLDKQMDQLEEIDPHDNLESLEQSIGIMSSMLAGHQRRLCENIRFIVSRDGTLPEIEAASVDYVFSFDTFVHFDRELFDVYLEEIARVLKPAGVLHLHYAQALTENQSVDFRYREPLELFGLMSSLGFSPPTKRWMRWDGWGSVMVECLKLKPDSPL